MAKLRITWVRSAIDYRRDQRETMRALGLRRLNQTVEKADNATLRGMVGKVKHLVTVEEVSE